MFYLPIRGDLGCIQQPVEGVFALAAEGHLLAPVLALPPLVLLHGGLHQAVDRLSRMLLLRRVPPAVRPDLRLQRRGGLFLREEACPHLATGDQLRGDREVLHQ